LPVTPLSTREIEYPLIHTVHAASSLASGHEAARWRQEMPLMTDLVPQGEVVPLRPLPSSALVPESIEAVIRRRGSARQFSHAPIEVEQLSTLLACANRAIPGDGLNIGRQPMGDLYLIVNAVDGLAAGSYVAPRASAVVERLHPGDVRQTAGRLALHQALGADAAVNLYFMIDLEPVFASFGNRGYRAAQLAAAISGGRAWLAAYALGLAATGLTFFDEEVTTFFSPHANGKSVLFLLAVGHPRRTR
jgi:nitroreductase